MKKNELILSVRDLNIKFNLRGKILHAIRGIDLDVYHGEVLAIVGESGSGKSVFTKSFMGLLDSNGSITSGTIDYFGADDHQPIRLSELKKEKDWLKVRGHEIAMIMQDPMTSLNPLKTIGDQIMEAVELHQGLKGAAAREKTLEYLRDVGIADPEVRFKQYPHEFSGGMRQRVVIAIAVACNPQILICDEPTTALDVTIQAQILELLKEMRVKYNLTIILITHDNGIAATAHRVVRFFIARDNLPLNLGAYFRVVRLLRPARQKKRTQYESFSCLPAPSRSVFPPWFPKPPPTMSNNSKFCTQNGTEIVPG